MRPSVEEWQGECHHFASTDLVFSRFSPTFASRYIACLTGSQTGGVEDMTDRETRQSRKRRRQELMAQAMKEREVRAVGPELTGPQGVGAPRVTGPDDRNRTAEPGGPKKLPLPD
jgi:hypothetical protein